MSAAANQCAPQLKKLMTVNVWPKSETRVVDTLQADGYHAKMIMNLIFKLTPLLALVASFGLSPTAQALPTQPATIRIVLKGMVCAYCAHGLTQRLNARPELESVQVRLASRDAVLKVKPAHQLAEADLRQAASDAGLQIERIEYPTE